MKLKILHFHLDSCHGFRVWWIWKILQTKMVAGIYSNGIALATGKYYQWSGFNPYGCLARVKLMEYISSIIS